MRESKFILQNREKWQKYEAGIRNDSLPAEEMERAFVELNDDLAYARTFYKNRAVRLFLNNLLAPVYNRIYSTRKWNWAGLKTFFLHDAVLMNFRARKYLLFSLIVVLLGFFIGFIGTQANMDFATTILGEDYVRITEYNISHGDPLAIYKYQNPWDMFAKIAVNNLKVAFYFFLFGALFCVGSIYLLLANGIMLGVFTYIFTSKGLTNEYFLTVYQHGTLEILSMVIEGAAGIMMGAGFLFPGTKTRMRSIQDNAKTSILMFLVCIPIIVLAAFIESYLTRFTEIPAALRLAIIFLSFCFMLGYFVILPWLKFRKNKAILGKYDTLEPDMSSKIIPGKIYPIGKTVLFGFDFIKEHLGKILWIAIIAVLFLFPMAEFITHDAISNDLQFLLRQYQSQVVNITDARDLALSGLSRARLLFFNLYSACYLFSANLHLGILAISFLILGTGLFFILKWNTNFIYSYTGHKLSLRKTLVTAILCAGLQITFNGLFGSYWWFGMLVIWPILVQVATVYMCTENMSFLQAFVNGMGMVFGRFGKFITGIFVTAALYFILMVGILFLITNIVQESQQMHGGTVMSVKVFYFYARLNYFILPFILTFTTYIYFVISVSILESKTGQFLHKKIDKIHFRKEVYGIETES